jgi:hypothetical protein
MFELYDQGVRAGDVRLVWPWGDGKGRAELVNGRLVLPPLRRGVMVRIDLSES